MFEALRQRIHEIETASRAIPDAAIAIANKLRVDVRQRKGAASRRRRQTREALAAKGYSPATIRLMVVMPKRKSSGVSIRVVPNPTEVVVTASTQVQHFARVQDERGEWMEIFQNRIVDAAKGKS